MWVQGWAGGHGCCSPDLWGPNNSHSWWLTGPVPALVLGDTLAIAPLRAHSDAPLPGTVPCKTVPDADARDGSLPCTGSLIQVPMSEKGKITRGRLGSLSLKKEGERQCFLFSKHLIICTRGSGGKLHLTKVRRVGGLGNPQRRVWQLPGLEQAGGRICFTWSRCLVSDVQSSESWAKMRNCKFSIKEVILICSRNLDNLFSEKLKL